MIPDKFIEDADKYILVANDSDKPIKLGGRIMMNQVVREQMTMDNIIATTGFANKVCIIMVDYSAEQILHFIRIARAKLQKLSN